MQGQRRRQLPLAAVAALLLLASSVAAQPSPSQCDQIANPASSPAGWDFLDSAQMSGGWIHLTPLEPWRRGAAIAKQAFYAHEGMILEFEYSTFAGTGADGFTVFLIDAGTQELHAGGYGACLGYSEGSMCQEKGVPQLPGIPGAIVGIGFDEWGNFSKIGAGPGGTPNDTGQRADSVVIRGGQASGYEYLAGVSLQDTDKFPTLPSRSIKTVGPTDPRKVQVVLRKGGFSPDPSVKESDWEVTVSMKFTPKQSEWTEIISATLTGLPDAVRLGFSGATGTGTDFHQIRYLSCEWHNA